MTTQREIAVEAEASDDELMRRVRGGSRAEREEAFRELVRRHAAGLRGFVAPIAGAGQADDVVQEAFLRVYQERRRYRAGPASFRSWLFRIGRNLALNTRRKGQRLRPLEAAPVRESAEPGPAEALSKRGDARAVRAAVEDLPASEREVIALRYQQGLTYAEVGRVLGISPAAAKQRSWRALQRLRSRMEEQ